MVMMTTDANMRSVMVERDKQLINPFDFMFTVQFFLSCVSISSEKLTIIVKLYHTIISKIALSNYYYYLMPILTFEI